MPGSTGKTVDRLLADAQDAGREAMETALRSAIARRIQITGGRPSANPLFTNNELQALQQAILRAIISADLLGRARIVRQAERFRSRKQTFAADVPDVLADLPAIPGMPVDVVEYFRSLVPTLGIDPAVYGPLMERHAFTLAVATEKTLLDKVQTAIADYLRTDWLDPNSADKVHGARVVQQVLDQCGVTAKHPQYAEMCFRTNVIDAYNTGATRQIASPEMQEEFPAWRYLSIDDGRARHTHAAKNGKFYRSSIPFAEVRGTDISDVANCRCTFEPIHTTIWDELQAAGEQFSDI